MNQSEKFFHQKFKLLFFNWLVEDWQGCKQELKRLIDEPELQNRSFIKIIQTLIYLEKNNLTRQNEPFFTGQGLQTNTLLKVLLIASIEKNILKAKAQSGFEVTGARVRKLIQMFTDNLPTARLVELVMQTITVQQRVLNSLSTSNSVEAWFAALQKNEVSIGNDELVQVETTLNSLHLSEKETRKYRIALADKFMTLENFQSALRMYEAILATSEETEAIVVKYCRAQRNLGNLKGAIETLESSIKRLGRKPLLLHVLAVYYRDKQCFQTTLRLVKEVISKHHDYSLKIGFASFAADMLRKDADYITAYEHLLKATEQLKGLKSDIPLTVEAMLAELKVNVADGHKTFFEVSSVFYDRIYMESDNYALEASESIYQPIWDEVCNLIEREKVERVIDIGCGPGQFSEYLTDRLPTADYLGLDFSETAINLARKRCPMLSFACEDVRNYTSDSGDIKTVYIMLEVLEHIDDDINLLKLFPSGANVIFSVPNFDSFGHVRFFKTSNEIKKRYKSVFRNMNVKEINLSRTSRIYLVNSIR
ncbi:class I SAM-dependent methyltransferase [Idiomarina sp. UBA3162]|uniref:class I SAM-dependent methyltransferase n=1 Tax=Idiomarina sp. UBA3162 TaxID=1946641 RepID=UPI000C8C9546|nr:class I SAM-dependent methyltransferase [Idiomarina sp. UBA3162]MAD52456.1 hypothetical protein [Idiomarinaceae bacterium]|tara:strand:+ start:1844 stop:3454 length:1611 start_codon:yes stop_codon:yes gene_type:complete